MLTMPAFRGLHPNDSGSATAFVSSCTLPSIVQTPSGSLFKATHNSLFRDCYMTQPERENRVQAKIDAITERQAYDNLKGIENPKNLYAKAKVYSLAALNTCEISEDKVSYLLHKSIQKGNRSAFRVLIRRGAKPHFPEVLNLRPTKDTGRLEGVFGLNAMEIALKHKRYDYLAETLRHLPCDEESKFAAMDCFHKAVMSSDYQAMNIFLDHGIDLQECMDFNLDPIEIRLRVPIQTSKDFNLVLKLALRYLEDNASISEANKSEAKALYLGYLEKYGPQMPKGLQTKKKYYDQLKQIFQ